MPGNPRFDAMLDSVKQDGIRDPLTINLKWQIIDGNHRLAVAKFLGIKTVEVRVWTGTELIE
jgi:ParB-like chromosome segregation protein Spo0J